MPTVTAERAKALVALGRVESITISNSVVSDPARKILEKIPNVTIQP